MVRVTGLAIALAATASAIAGAGPAAAAPGPGRAMLAAATASRLDADDLARIGRGEIVFDVEDAGRGDRKIRFAGAVNGQPDTVYRVLANFDIYDEVLPAYFIESRVTGRDTAEIATIFKFRTYWPFPERHVLNRYQVDPERRALAWWRVGGSVVKNDGTVVVRPWGGDRSLVDFRVAVDPGIPFIPHWIFEWAERQVVPGVLTSLDGYLTRTRTAIR
ncbi:MAG: SRPBCC family protein [Candidatus Sericytochromatia bacterium]|nr:SRPBCC family protein [Candidatus Tanganyikabacteria bacterium]